MTNETRPIIGFAALASIGSVGVLDQAALLHNDLVHSYPFKMMGMPHADFFSSKNHPVTQKTRATPSL